MLCGYLDDPRQWDEPEAIEEEGLLTDAEKRLEWICSDWADAITNDRHEEWHDLHMMLHGALQALNHCPDRHDDRMAIMALNTLAYQYSLDCIKAGRYEGATN